VYGKSTKYCRLDETKQYMAKRFWWQDFDDCGYNFRMTDVQAAVGIEQLKKLDAFNQRRRENAAYLTSALAEIPGLTLPTVSPDCTHVFHLYAVRLDENRFGMSRDDFIYDMLHEHGVKVGTHYTPLTWTSAFRKRGFHEGQMPVADRIARQLVTLPVAPRLTQEALQYLVRSIQTLARQSS
jgi:dTDP-4-amino-4,6-dideoxygalactose transaminase